MRLWGLHRSSSLLEQQRGHLADSRAMGEYGQLHFNRTQVWLGRPCPTDGSAIVHTATTGRLLTVGQDAYHGCCTYRPKHLPSYLLRKAPPWSGRLSG